MSHTYQLNETSVEEEDGIVYIVYGIDIVDKTGNIVESFTDIFFDRLKAESFVALCNESELSLVHIVDWVEDALY